MHLSTDTAMRRGEVLGLRWSDINLDSDRPTITVSKALARTRQDDGGRCLELVTPKTERSRRTFQIRPALSGYLRAHRRAQAERRLAAGTAWQDWDLVCDRGDGGPLDLDAFGKAAQRFAARIGLDGMRLHDVRHGVASVLLEQGVHISIVSAMLGHASAAFTIDVYGHIGSHMTGQAAAAFDAATGTEDR